MGKTYGLSRANHTVSPLAPVLCRYSFAPRAVAFSGHAGAPKSFQAVSMIPKGKMNSRNAAALNASASGGVTGFKDGNLDNLSRDKHKYIGRGVFPYERPTEIILSTLR